MLLGVECQAVDLDGSVDVDLSMGHSVMQNGVLFEASSPDLQDPLASSARAFARRGRRHRNGGPDSWPSFQTNLTRTSAPSS